MKIQTILKRVAVGLGILCLLSVVLAVALYYMAIMTATSSQPYENYAHIGSFFGGIINPLLAVINICIFVYLTILIRQATDENNEASIRSSKSIALLNLKFDEFKHFRQEIDRALDLWVNESDSPERFQAFLTTYNIQEHRLSVLLPELSKMENNRSIRSYIMKASEGFRVSDGKEAGRYCIGISNTYGMLISEIGKNISNEP